MKETVCIVGADSNGWLQRR